ncbi:MAG: GntR family transcriptional regulator [Tissierellia bacterium]|nr:GntR family transcriptional regulator [Tissierellia bacterium]
MDFNNNLPIYIQIMNLIKSRIISGNISGGDKLPSVRDLSKELRVNPNTIQRAYQELEREGLVFTQRGMGTFATEDMEIIKNLKKTIATDLVDKFFIEMKKLGFTSHEVKEIVSEWMEREERE